MLAKEVENAYTTLSKNIRIADIAKLSKGASDIFRKNTGQLAKLADDGVPGALSALIEVLRVYSDYKIKVKIEKMNEEPVTNAVKEMLGAA